MAVIGLAAIAFIVNFKSSKNQTIASKQQSKEMPAAASTAPISEQEFITSIFSNLKAPQYVGRAIINTNFNADSNALAVKWAMEAGLAPLYYYLKNREYQNTQNLAFDTLSNFARELMFTASNTPNSSQAKYLAQLSKTWIEKGLETKPNHLPLLNALIIYQSQYEDMPMKFLATLRKAQSIDSTNEETNLIHLNLLKSSGQLEKAMQKCKKLVSLQPQNPLWLFQLSETYAMQGDSMQAKTFLDLGIKLQRSIKK